MAKKVESQLVISARDLGTKKLKELATAFRQVRQEQRETAAVSDRTQVSMAELRTTIGQLETVMKQIDQRRALVDSFQQAQVAAQKATTRLNEAREALSKYEAELKQTGASGREVTARLNSLGRGVKSAEQNLQRATERAGRLGNELKDLGLDSARSATELKRLGAVTERALREASAAADQLPRQQRAYREELKRTADAERQAAADRKAAIAAEREIVRQRIAAERQVRSGFNAFSSRATTITSSAAKAAALAREQAIVQRSIGVQQRADEVEARLASRKRETASVLSRLGAAYRSVLGPMRGYGVAQQQAATAGKRAVDIQRTSLSLAQRVRGQVLSLTASYVGLFGVINFGTGAIRTFNDRLSLQRRLLVANNDSVTGARRDFAFLRAEAERLGFSLNDLGGVYSKLAIAGSSAGLQARETQEIFSSFAEVSRVNNLSTEETGRVFRALEQILSKGKVQAEELRGQLGDVLPGAATTFAQSLGVTTAELDKLLEKGQVSSRALVGFAETYRKKVAGQLDEATGSLTAQLGRLSTAYQDFLLVVAEEGLADAVGDVANELSRFLKSAEGKDAARDIAEAFRLLGQLALAAVQNLDKLIDLTKIFLAVFAGQQIGKVGVALGGIATAFAGTGTAAAGATVAVTGFRAVLLTLGRFAGPIGFLLTTLAGLYLLFADNAGEAAEKTAELEAELKRLSDANTQAKNSADLLQKAERAHAEAVDAVTKAREELARAPKEDSDEARKERERAKANLDRAEAILKIRDAERERQAQFAKRNEETAQQLRDRNKELADEAKKRRDVAQATLEQAEAELALVSARMQQAVGGRAQEAMGSQAARLQARIGTLRQGANEADQEYRRRLLLEWQGEDAGRGGRGPSGRGRGRQVNIRTPDPATTGGNGEDTLKKRRELEEQASKLALQVYRERLQQQLKLDEDYLEAQIALIESEYAERIAEATSARAELAALGGDTTSLDNAIAELNVLRQSELTEARRASIERQRTTERENAAKVIQNAEKEIDRLIDEHARKREQIEQDRAAGRITDLAAARKTQEEDLRYQELVQQKVQQLRDLINSLDASLVRALGLDETLAKLDEAENKIRVLDLAAAKAAELREQVAGGAADAFGALGAGIADVILGVGSLGDAFKSARDSFLNFAADFLIEIGKMIIKQQILNALQSAAAGGGDGGFFSTLANAVLGTMHTGGMVGSAAKTRSISPLAFAGAARYHNGGMVGLGPDEVPIIAKRGEEVVTADDPRNRMNGGAGKQPVQIINQIDSGSVIEAGLNSPAGGNAIKNYVRANKAAFKALLA